MVKKLNTTITSCANCPHLNKNTIDDYTSYYCGLGSMYVGTNVYNNTIHEMCLLEDREE